MSLTVADPTLPDEQGITWVPVRHHSPAAARAVRDLVDRLRPAAILIEGPDDVTDLGVLHLGHELPVALMSWVRLDTEAGERASYSLYPLTSFSAEWQAIERGRAVGARVEFIDLPWWRVLALRANGNREADASGGVLELEPEQGFYAALAEYTGRADLTSVWDEFFEIDTSLDVDTYLRRAAVLGAGVRRSTGVDGPRPDPENAAREQHMAARIREVRASMQGELMVVTGAFHTAGLQALLRGPAPAGQPAPQQSGAHGWALVPTSYELLDANSGYLAGQPDPGFYDLVFADPSPEAVPGLLHTALARLREEEVYVSAADSIAAMTTARALQQVRGHSRMWRDDLVEAVASVLVKDSVGDSHPLLRVLHDELRGQRVGRLGAGTPLPHLVTSVHERFATLGIALSRREQRVETDLDDTHGREVSRLLHGLATLGVPGVGLLVDVSANDPAEVTSRSVIRTSQTWRLSWSEDADAALILEARWGPTVATAVAATLATRAADAEVDDVAKLVMLAARCGLGELSARLLAGLRSALATSEDLPRLASALRVLVRLFHFESWVDTVDPDDLRGLLTLSQQRCVRAVERLADPTPGAETGRLVTALRVLVEATLTVAQQAEVEVEGLGVALAEQLRQPHTPELQGALIGAGWLLTGDPEQGVQAALGDPAGAGQFYAGLLGVARHLVVVSPQVFDAADTALRTWSDDDFLAALPDLRRALASLSPAERSSLVAYLGGIGRTPSLLAVDEATLVRLAAREAELWRQVEYWSGGLVTR